MPMNLKPFKVIAIDADDTLWDCQSHFDNAEAAYCQLLADYNDAKHISDALFETEKLNMSSLGFGTKAFTLSLLETAIKVSGGCLSGKVVAEILQLGKALLSFPTTPLPGVEDTLIALNERKGGEDYRLVVFTKGELLDQESKFNRSGLCPYFEDIIVVSDKTEEAYHHLCHQFGVKVGQLLMVGNSFRSDIEPVLKLGGWAAHIPFHTVWQHEVVEEYDHPHLLRLKEFVQLPDLL